MAISAIPTGLPAFVSAMLSYGAKQLAAAKAVVKNLTDVETLGSTSAINTDKTGTLTMNQMMVSTLYANGSWFTVEGEGYRKSGAILSVAGVPVPDFGRLALGLALDTDATVADDGAVVGDPTEAALVVLAAKLGVDAEETRRAYPRLAEVPFDSEYKFMATFHRWSLDGTEYLVELVKGAPDVVLARCSHSGGPLSGSQVPIEQARDGIEAANARMGEKGLRVLAFAIRLIDQDQAQQMTDDPMSLTHDLAFAGMVGIIDPLRAEAKAAVAIALHAGIDVRMITGDHAVTASAIGETLGLGPGAISGAELQAMSDEELERRLPALHVFGRVSPEDKLRLARVMQRQGLIVAMTGDAVNDAAALKQADIGVAMGSGSEVTKQAARMILTDDNFGTLVHAVELGRRVYAKIVAYVRFQMTQLLALVMLFVAATAFNINQGVALTPTHGPVPAVLRDRGRSGGDHGGPGRPGRDEPPAAGPEDPDHQPDSGHFLDRLRCGPVPVRAGTAGRRTGHAQQRPRQRLDDDDIRRDGLRHRVQRVDQPSRADVRAHAPDSPGAGDLDGSGCPGHPGHPDPRPAGRPADDDPDRHAVAGVRRSRTGAAAGRRGQQVDPPTHCPARGGGGRCGARSRSRSRGRDDHRMIISRHSGLS